MTRFVVTQGVAPARRGVELIYDDPARSFFARGESETVYSLLVNDLEIHVDAQDCVVYVDGYCPRETWADAVISPPDTQEGEIRVLKSIDLARGESARLTTTPTEWPAAFDRRRGWLCVGSPSHPPSGEAIRINEGTILVLKDEAIAAIWLKVVPMIATKGRAAGSPGRC